jgi:hypothetical protein
MEDEFKMIAIVDSDQSIETRSCRLVHLPNGTRAALWRGLAWPIGVRDTIDIAGPAYPLLTQDLAPGPLFGLIDGAEQAWLVLEGPITSRDTAVSTLRQAGITVLRSGPWLGDPVDGIVGTSFICFVRPDTDDLRQTITKILEGTIAPSKARPNPAVREHALTIELMQARAEVAQLQTVRQKHALSVFANTDNELAYMRRQNFALLEEIADLRRQLTEVVPIHPEPRRAVARLQDEVASFIATLRPDLRFLRDSLTVLSGEFADRGGLYRAVAELNSDILGRSWKKIHGAPGWWERHVSNGQDDSGRIYARTTGGSWDLLVSHKSQQTRDIVWLSRQAA